MAALKVLAFSPLCWLVAGALLGPSVSAQVTDQPLVADPADFDFTPLLLTEATIAQNGADQSQSGTGNEPVSVTPGESKAKEEGSLDALLDTSKEGKADETKDAAAESSESTGSDEGTDLEMNSDDSKPDADKSDDKKEGESSESGL